MTVGEKAKLDAITDLSESAEKILADIHGASHERDRHGNPTVSVTIAKFSTLLVLLSRQAKEESDRALKIQEDVVTLTRRLYGLTLFLAILTALMFIQQLVSYFRPQI
jgi:hypothetical protein